MIEIVDIVMKTLEITKPGVLLNAMHIPTSSWEAVDPMDRLEYGRAGKHHMSRPTTWDSSESMDRLGYGVSGKQLLSHF